MIPFSHPHPLTAGRAGWYRPGCGLAALLVVLAIIGCRPTAPEPKPKGPETAGEIGVRSTPVKTVLKRPRVQVSETSVTSRSLRVWIEWPRREEIPSTVERIGLCLPSGRTIRSRLGEASVGQEAVRVQTENPAPVDLPDGVPVARPAGDAVTLEELGYFRHWPIWRVEIKRPVLEALRKAGERHAGPLPARLALDLAWDEPVMKPEHSSGPEGVAADGERQWREMARCLVGNPNGLARYRRVRPPLNEQIRTASTHPRQLWPGERSWARLEVSRPGVYRVHPDDLIKCGFKPSAVQIDGIRIFSRGRAVSTFRRGDMGLDAFLPEGVYFRGRGGTGPYSRKRIYWVTVDPTLPPSRVAVAGPVTPRQTDSIQNQLWREAVHDRDHVVRKRTDRFLTIQAMRAVDAPIELQKPLVVPVAMPHAIAGQAPMELKLQFFVDQQSIERAMIVAVEANKQSLGNIHIGGVHEEAQVLELSPGMIEDGWTTLSLRLLRGGQASGYHRQAPTLWFDEARVTYRAHPRLVEGTLRIESLEGRRGPTWTPLPEFDAADSPLLIAMEVGSNPEQIRIRPIQQGPDGHWGVYWNARPGVHVELVRADRVKIETPPMSMVRRASVTGEGRADLLIIYHRQFERSVNTLAEHHRAEGLAVRTVEIQGIYDTFSHGELSPAAIRDYLGHLLQHGAEDAPGLVLLFGDCTMDYQHIIGNGVRNYVPSHTFSYHSDQWASDHWLTAVTADDLADFMIGRISVNNREDAANVVGKIIDYAKRKRAGAWRWRLAWVCDKDAHSDEFARHMDALRKKEALRGYAAREIYLGRIGLEDNWYLDPNLAREIQPKVSGATTERIYRTWREGVAYLSYFGHGSPNIWSNMRIWFGGDSTNSDNQHLAGTRSYPFVVNFTCNTGAIDFPERPWNICITEDMMRIAKGGAIGCFAPSGPSQSSLHRSFGEQLEDVIFGEGLRGMGQVATLTRARSSLYDISRGLTYMYILQGDPALALALPEPSYTFELDQQVYAPGSELEVALEGIEPATGRWMAQMVDQQDRTLWTAKGGNIRDGKIRFTVPVPAEAPSGETFIRIYGWNERTGADALIWSRIEVAWPEPIELELAFADAVRDDRRVQARLFNPGRVEATGRVDLWWCTRATTSPLVSERFAIGPGQTRTVVAKTPPAAGKGPAVVTACVRMDQIGGEPSVPAEIRRGIPVPEPPGLPRLVIPLSRIEKAGQRSPVRVVATVHAVSDTTPPLHVGVDMPNGRRHVSPVETASGEADEVCTGTLEFYPSDLSFPEGCELWLSRSPAGEPRLDSVDLTRLDAWEPRVCVLTGSLSHSPERPTAGETIFVNATVVNEGRLRSEAQKIALFGQDETGRPVALDQHYKSRNWEPIPALGPGRRHQIRLRWDPTDNAGTQKIWVAVGDQIPSVQAGRPAGVACEEVTVLTKAELYLDHLRVEHQQRDVLGDTSVTVKATVGNRGQTDAHRVMVSFFRSRIQSEGNKLGEVELSRVPGEGTAVAEIPWPEAAERTGELPEPSVQIWLKGSARRISDLGEGEIVDS